MNTQPNAGHIDHASFDHVLAGLEHLRVTHRERLRRLEQERRELEIQRAALARELRKHAHVHDVWGRSPEGQEEKSQPVESRTDGARRHFHVVVAGTVVGVALGVYSAVNTTRADSVLLLFVGSVVVAVGLGMFLYRRPGVYQEHHHLLHHAAAAGDHSAGEHVDPLSAGHHTEEYEEARHGVHPAHAHAGGHLEGQHEAVGH